MPGKPWVGLVLDYDSRSGVCYVARLSKRLDDAGYFQVFKTTVSADGKAGDESRIASRGNLDFSGSTYRVEMASETPGTISFSITELPSGKVLIEGVATDPSPRDALSPTAGLYSNYPQAAFDDFELQVK
jgi:hypothetical protein